MVTPKVRKSKAMTFEDLEADRKDDFSTALPSPKKTIRVPVDLPGAKVIATVDVPLKVETSALDSNKEFKINLIREYTYSALVLLTLIANFILLLLNKINISNDTVIGNALFLIIGFYLGRSNFSFKKSQKTG